PGARVDVAHVAVRDERRVLLLEFERVLLAAVAADDDAAERRQPGLRPGSGQRPLAVGMRGSRPRPRCPSTSPRARCPTAGCFARRAFATCTWTAGLATRAFPGRGG